jgi:hypothetical protein
MSNDPRDPRAAQILVRPIRVQAWFQLPSRDWPSASLFADDVVQTTVELDQSSGPRTALLVEFDSKLTDLDKWLPDEQARLRDITACVRFAGGGTPRLIAARLVEAGRAPGQVIRIRICSPEALGARFGKRSLRLPANTSVAMSNLLLARTLREDVRRSLHWYLAGVDASDPFVEALCLWSCIEALCPRGTLTARCKDCESPLRCSTCDCVPTDHKVGAHIKDLLEPVSGLSRRQIGERYSFRSRLVHGGEEPTHATFDATARHAEEIRPLAQKLLWRELHAELGTGFQYEQQPEHLSVDVDLILQSEWFEGVYESPHPLFADLEFGVGDLPEGSPGDLVAFKRL